MQGMELGLHTEVDPQGQVGKVQLQQVGMALLQVQVDRQVPPPQPAKLGIQVELEEWLDLVEVVQDLLLAQVDRQVQVQSGDTFQWVV